MKVIPLTKGYSTKVSDQDYAKLMAMGEWCAYEKTNGRVYAYKDVRGKSMPMHRVIKNVTDPKIDVDHRDHDGLNNQRGNLRVATRSLNNGNARKRTGDKIRSKYKGVARNKPGRNKPWFARLQMEGKVHYLGAFLTEEEAALAYNVAAKKHFGKFANLNVIKESTL